MSDNVKYSAKTLSLFSTHKLIRVKSYKLKKRGQASSFNYSKQDDCLFCISVRQLVLSLLKGYWKYNLKWFIDISTLTSYISEHGYFQWIKECKEYKTFKRFAFKMSVEINSVL